jgi:hypothetical protein
MFQGPGHDGKRLARPCVFLSVTCEPQFQRETTEILKLNEEEAVNSVGWGHDRR